MAAIASLGDPAERERALAGIEAIFFVSAATRQFVSPDARAAFHELWLGRYLRHFPDWCFAAAGEDGAMTGYLAGAPISGAEPVPGPDYYEQLDAALLEAYPAHIHVNVRPEMRCRGVGERLITAFRAHCRAHGVPGFHAVTAANSRASAFFAKCGLAPRPTIEWRGKRIVFLGESLV
jgi:GNAT superfamily N-acetyltransferase